MWGLASVPSMRCAAVPFVEEVSGLAPLLGGRGLST